MSSLHIINTVLPGVLCCHIFIMCARLHTLRWMFLSFESLAFTPTSLALCVGTSPFLLLSIMFKVRGYSMKGAVINYEIHCDHL